MAFAWLCGLTDPPKEKPKQHVPIVVEIHGDGYIQVFTDRQNFGASVRIVHRPKVRQKNQKLIEEIIDRALPKKFSEIRTGGNIAGTGNLREDHSLSAYLDFGNQLPTSEAFRRRMIDA